MQKPLKQMTFNFRGKEVSFENIKDLVSDQQVYEFYMKEIITLGKKYLSPFRITETPNFTFLAINIDTLLWRDWGDENQERPAGVVAFVSKIFSCTYQEALSVINRDMCLGLSENGVTPQSPNKKIELPVKRKLILPKEYKLIEVEYQSFNKDDVKYWKNYGIDLPQLIRYGVRAAKYVWLDGTLVRIYTRSNPVYSYNLGQENNRSLYKIYTPLANKKRKWLTNAKHHVIQGLDQLTWTDYKLIITKSLKDVMLIDDMGFDAIALQSEQSPLPDYLKAMLESAYDEIYVLFDNDPVGIKNSIKLCTKHGFQYIEIPDKHEVKDLSDFVKKFGYLKGRELLNKLLKEGNINDYPPY